LYRDILTGRDECKVFL